MINRMIVSGFGGQGVMSIGKSLVEAGVNEGLHVTWVPSYGPEMRGGTANCTGVVSDRPIACPLINDADVLVVMNLPSLLKFESMVRPGGLMIVNSSMVPEKASRDDIRVLYVPANEKASALGSDKAANMVVLGAILRETGVVNPETVRDEMRHMFSGRKEKYLAMNLAALEL